MSVRIGRRITIALVLATLAAVGIGLGSAISRARSAAQRTADL
jgi:glucose-6-phosphate-specific signal transduction histidine kinase